MKRTATIFWIVMLVTAVTFAAPWQVVKQASTEMQVDRGCFIDANTGWIVYSTTYPSNAMGWVQKTTDGGATWTTLRAPEATLVDLGWTDMEFINTDVGYACGKRGVIYKTTDGGYNWTMIADTNTYKSDLLDLDVVDANVVFFAGKASTLLKTADGGTSITPVANATTVFADDLNGGIAFCSPTVGVVAVDNKTNPMTWYTHDGGATWTGVSLAGIFPAGLTSKRVYDVAAGGDSTVAIAAFHHITFLSKDGGKSYTVSGPYTTSLKYSNCVDVIDANTIVTGGGTDAYLAITTDGGSNWTVLKCGTGQTTAFFDFVNANTGYVFGYYGMWLKTINGGSTWTSLVEWPQVSFWGLAFPTPSQIVLTTFGGGEVTKSNDGGKTWGFPSNLATNFDGNLFELEFGTATTGLTGGDGGTLLKTTDAGSSWSAPIASDMVTGNKAINAMHYLNADTVYMGGGSGYLVRSLDGGATWTKLTTGTTKTIYDICPIAANQVVLAAGSGEYCISSDGATFTKVGAVAGTPNLRAVKFRNGVGILPAASGKIYRTTSWNVLPTLVYTATNTAELYDVEFVDDNIVYVVGQYGTILKSEDAGLNWTEEASLTTEVLQKVRLNGGKLWAVGQGGVILMNPLDIPDTVTVSFLANTAGVPDTLWESSTVQMRGNWPFTWGSDSPVFMYPIGGDYWRADVAIPYDSLNRVFEYKFCTFPVPPGELTGEMNGWEAGANRTLDLRTFAGADTVLPLQYVRGWKGDAGQFEAPFALTDSIDVFLRVNMEALIKSQAFNPETEVVGVRGSNAWDTWAGTPDFNWGSTHVFVPENIHANGIWGSTYNGTYFYNGVLHLPRDWAGREIQYKFIIGDDWGRADNNNRSFILPGDTSDVTVHWVWFNDVPPAGFTGNDTSDITFFADMTKALNNNGFEIGDTLLVRYGYFGSSVQVETATMVRQTGSERYFVTVEDVPLAFGKPFYYQYYMIKGGLEQREVYFNFDYEGSVPSEAERRAFVVTTGTTVIADILDSETEARRMPVFRNNQKLAQAITVTVECDLRPAIYQVKAGSTLVDIQAGMTITPEMLTAAPDTIAQLGLFINGPMSNNAEGTWVTWGGTLAGDANRQMWDDGTHGDAVAGDSVYTIVYAFDPALGHRVGQEFKFGIGGGDNESGYGLNHIENLDDSQPTSVMYNQWGSINPKFYDAWDYDNPKPRVAVKENIPLVTKYALDQNYPNPFNPTTQIRFAVPEECDVQLVIYNALGQLVNKVTYRNLAMGVYSYFWDGTDLRGSHVASGVYFYELRAGEKFRDLKKMVLIK